MKDRADEAEISGYGRLQGKQIEHLCLGVQVGAVHPVVLQDHPLGRLDIPFLEGLHHLDELLANEAALAE